MDTKIPTNEELLKMLPLSPEQLATFVRKINEEMQKTGKVTNKGIPRNKSVKKNLSDSDKKETKET